MMAVKDNYRTAFAMLDQFWLAYRSDFDDDLPALLGAMAVNADGAPMDPALAEDWSGAERAAGTADGLRVLARFLSDWRARGEGEGRDISRLLTWIQDFPHSAEQLWHEADEAVRSPSR
jgi:hypothetical protein